MTIEQLIIDICAAVKAQDIKVHGAEITNGFAFVQNWSGAPRSVEFKITSNAVHVGRFKFRADQVQEIASKILETAESD